MIKDGVAKSEESKEETFKKARLNSNSSNDLNNNMGKRVHKALTGKIDRRVRTANRRELLNNRLLRNQVLKRDAVMMSYSK